MGSSSCMIHLVRRLGTSDFLAAGINGGKRCTQCAGLTKDARQDKTRVLKKMHNNYKIRRVTLYKNPEWVLEYTCWIERVLKIHLLTKCWIVRVLKCTCWARERITLKFWIRCLPATHSEFDSSASRFDVPQTFHYGTANCKTSHLLQVAAFSEVQCKLPRIY